MPPASAPTSHTGSVDAAFRAQVRRTPDATALRTHDITLSYSELNCRSDAFAAHLKTIGVKPGMTVAMLLPRSADAIITMLGILKAGAAFVPFDPDYPQAALAAMAEDCNPAVMVANVVPAFWRGPTFVPAMLAGASTPQCIEAINEHAPDSLASVMYTSGSTGRPKGVMVPHRAIMRLVIGADFAAFGPDEVILQLAPLSFDASTFEIWGALLNGGTLAIETTGMPSLDDIAYSIRLFGVTTLWLTAGLFHLMVDQRPDALRGLRQLLAGGDILSPGHVLRQLRNAPDCRLINGYGPTENTTFTCCYTIPTDWDGAGPVPIGMPINGTKVFILDKSLHPVPDGEAGELCAAGDGLALGYLNQAELTSQRFVESPFGPPGARLYRTGDLVRRRADGAIAFLGRLDRQVKINGKRIELEAVEAALSNCPNVRLSAALVEEPEPGRKRLVAYVAAGPGPDIDVAIARYLAAELPSWMMPGIIHVLDTLPLTPSGKVDRRALPTLVAGAPVSSNKPPIAISNGRADDLARLWAQVLCVAEVDPNRNFFDLGGTSLQMLELHEMIRRELSCDVALIDMFAHPTVAGLAASMTDTLLTPTLAAARKRAERQTAALRRFQARPRNTLKNPTS